MGIMLKPVIFAEFSTLIYFSDNPDRYLKAKESEFKTFDLDTKLGYFRISKNEVLVVFRGSCSMLDWSYNLKFWMAPFDLAENNRVRIHYGMNKKIQTSFNFLEEKIKPTDTVYLTGHSLGGALALLAAYAIKLRIGAKIGKVYVFGAPPVGNVEWANVYNSDRQLRSVTHDFMIDTDWVNFLPLRLIGYKAVGTPTKYLKTKPYFPTAIHAHLPWAYVVSLQKLSSS